MLNNPKYGGQILVAGQNFGSGSSREHAAWAIADFLRELFDSIFADPGTLVEVNLPAQTITNKATGRSEHFDINAYKKHCLMNGLDDIDFLLENVNKIECYEEMARR